MSFNPQDVFSVDLSRISESRVVLEVEQFVEKVRTDTSLSLDEFRQQLFKHLTLFTQVYDASLEYSARIKLFASIRLEVNYSINFHSYDILEYLNDQSLSKIRELFYQGGELIEQEEIKRQKNCQDNIIALSEYINLLLAHYARLMIVRVDLKYLSEAQALVNIHRFKKHMQDLCKQIGQHRKCFKNLQGFAWSMEQGEKEGGYHSHLLLIYDANAHYNDFTMGQKVGKLWKKIAEGHGCYFICNDSKRIKELDKKGICGLGLVTRGDTIKQKNVIKAASYLVKDSQHLCIKLSPTMRTFGKGEFKGHGRRGLEKTFAKVK